MNRIKIFADRAEAGRFLAERLKEKAYEVPVVLALPRGGVAVGFEIARLLEAPLDVVLVRKIGVPYQPELALAAVVDGGNPEVVVNEDVWAVAGVTREYLDAEVGRQLKEIERRRAYYLQGRKQMSLEGRTAIVVDDGIATGATVRAALKALRRKPLKKLVLAVPVAPADTLASLRSGVDDVICLETPDPLHAIGLFYRDFHQLSDEEVVALLSKARAGLEEASVADGR